MHNIPKNKQYQSYCKLILSEYQALNGRPADHGFLEAGDKGRDVYGIKRMILELAEIQRAIQDDDIDKEVIFDQINVVRNFMRDVEGEGMPLTLVKQTMDHVNHSVFNLPTEVDRLRARMKRIDKERKARKRKTKVKS
tara:strand:- start:725 stop:1138 length:414 start_codon:yes stop_codon:yes gene_type:complete